MAASFSQFIRERQYLLNVSPATVEWYKCSFKWLRSKNPTEDELQDAVMRMRRKGVESHGLQFRDQSHQCLSQVVRLAPSRSAFAGRSPRAADFLTGGRKEASQLPT